MVEGKHQSNVYAFDQLKVMAQGEEEEEERVRAYFNFSIPFMDEEARSGYERTYQLAVGPMNSGSPPHWHQPAFNGLFEGQKMWWMFPPAFSMYSPWSAGQWFYQEYQANLARMTGQQPLGNHYAFVQEPGDIVFVPNEWAHAVSNMEPSIAVAIEYGM